MEGINEESNGKSERREIREKIANAIFNLEQILKTDLGLSGIRKGEMQSEEFMSKVEEILGNEEIWAKVPETGEILFTLHGIQYKKEYTRDGLMKEIQDLVEKLR